MNETAQAPVEGVGIVAYRPRSYSVGILDSRTRKVKNGNLLFEIRNPLISFQSQPKPSLLCGYQVEEEGKSASYFRNLIRPWSFCCNKLTNFWKMHGSKLLDKIRYLQIVPGLLLTVGLSVVLSNLWLYEADTFLLGIALGFILVCLMMTYLDFRCSSTTDASASASCFWWALLLSLLTFGRDWYRSWTYDDRDRLADMLIMTSTALKCSCDFFDRFCKKVTYNSAFLSRSEVMTLLAFVLGGMFFLSIQTEIYLLTVTAAAAFVVVNFRMKCPLAFVYLLLFAAVSGVAVFDNFGSKLNPYALVCYHIRLFFPPITDFYFSPLSALERWSCSLTLGRCWHFLSMILLFVIESGFCALAFYAVRLHPEYELVFVVPIVGVSGLLWISMHFSYFATEGLLVRKLSECQHFLHKLPTSGSGTSLSHIMSSRGVRQICLIGQQTVACALATSVIFGAVSWRREDPFYPALLLIVIGTECCSFGRMRELAVKLGGTCAAYALVTPTTVTSRNSSVTILPPGSIQKQNSRATTIITSLHRFFALYLIENLGCDYFTTGLSLGTVENRLQTLFAKRTKESSGCGARHDTYIFYFSGLTSDDGSLVLGDGAVLSPDHVMDMWRESCCDGNQRVTSSSRLLLILDVPSPQPWIKIVKNLQRDYVAVQTCNMSPSTAHDAESAVGDPPPEPGTFTSDWVRWNCDVTNAAATTSVARWDDASCLSPIYITSRRWTDFALRVPTAADDSLVAKHWSAHYPGVCRPCLALSASCAARLQLVRMLGAPGRRYRRLKMRWFPPLVLDTGHGFKLLRS